jgi:hypothetical protein
MMSSRSFACLATLGLLLHTANARADGPPPAPLGSTPPPAPGYLPYPMPPPGWSPPQEPPYTPMKRRSSGMIAGGIVLVSLSTVGIIAGASMFAAGNQNQNLPVPFCPPNLSGCMQFQPPPVDSGLRAGGIATMVLGVAFLGAGIPLLAVGAQKVPDKDEASSPVPAVRVGAGTLSASWRF